jgi:CP family cyanate transporter-like MFS transporter
MSTHLTTHNAVPLRTGRKVLVFAGIVLLAFNLRPAVNSIGVVLPAIQRDLALSGFASGLLVALPTVAFAALGIMVPRFTAVVGAQVTVIGSLVLIAGGQLLRATLPGTWPLFVGSVLALSGIAVGNVVLPGLVRLYFPSSIASVTALYATVILVGGATSAGLTLPIQNELDLSWRGGIGVWSICAAVTLLPWLFELVRASGLRRRPRSAIDLVAALDLVRSRRGWIMVLLFGSQGLQGYVVFGWLPAIVRESGMSETASATAVTVTMGVGIPMSLMAPMMVRRESTMRVMMWVLSLSLAGAYVGLIVVPAWALWLHAPLIGVGSSIGAVIFALFAMRSRTPAGATALSAFAQSVGYLFASVGPLTFGLLRDATTSWTVPLLLLIVAAGFTLVSGLSALRPGFIEDELAVRSPSPPAGERGPS